MSDAHPAGRRERKKAATRASIVAAAHSLFLARGFDAVSVREIADLADVSPTTVFAHFPQKEALAFGDEDERHARLVSAVADRAPGTTISEALKAHYLAELAAFESEPQRSMLALMGETPSLVEYAQRMWFNHEKALAAAIAEEFKLAEPSHEISLYVRFALQIQLSASQESDPEPIVNAGFRLLDEGWTSLEKCNLAAGYDAETGPSLR